MARKPLADEEPWGVLTAFPIARATEGSEIQSPDGELH